MRTSLFAGTRALLTTIQGADAPAEPHFGELLLLVATLWLPVTFFLAFGNVGLRCSRFDLAMPEMLRPMGETQRRLCQAG